MSWIADLVAYTRVMFSCSPGHFHGAYLLIDRSTEQSEQLRQVVSKLQTTSKYTPNPGMVLVLPAGRAISTLEALVPLAPRTLIPGGFCSKVKAQY